jgi:molybdopterin converting factor small subunit
MNTQAPYSVPVRVELFGHARTVAGVSEVRLTLPPTASASDLAVALASALPALVSTALDEDGAALLSSYTANVNGIVFMGDDPVPISRGDSIFLFSSQAGG